MLEDKTMGGETVREAVGVFDSAETLEEAVDELESAGFDRAELSLLASEPAVVEKLGYLYTKADYAEDDPNAPRTAYVSTESVGDAEGGLIGGLLYVGAVAAAGAVVASGGALATAIGAAVAAGGAGGLIGAALAAVVDKHHADYLEKQLERGGLLLWVRTRNAEHEERAKEILSKHSAHDVHLHDIAVS
jgi:hypothetical protein